MILFINTADQGRIEVCLVRAGRVIRRGHVATPHHGGGKILQAVERLMQKRPLSELKGIIVVTGPGAFTAVRLGVVVANTLSWSLHIPISGIRRDTFTDFTDLATKSSALMKKAKKGRIIMPEYGAEPNITIRKDA